MPVLGTQKPYALLPANATQQSQPQVESISYTYTLYASIFIEMPLVVIPPPMNDFKQKGHIIWHIIAHMEKFLQSTNIAKKSTEKRI